MTALAGQVPESASWPDLMDIDDETYMRAHCRECPWREDGRGYKECRKVIRLAGEHGSRDHPTTITIERWRGTPS